MLQSINYKKNNIHPTHPLAGDLKTRQHPGKQDNTFHTRGSTDQGDWNMSDNLVYSVTQADL